MNGVGYKSKAPTIRIMAEPRSQCTFAEPDVMDDPCVGGDPVSGVGVVVGDEEEAEDGAEDSGDEVVADDAVAGAEVLAVSVVPALVAVLAAAVG